MSSRDVIWFRQPAADWLEALPIGNGRLGAMVYGAAPFERLQLNEDTLWSGYPRDTIRPQPEGLIDAIRERVRAGDYVDAGELSRALQGPFNQSYMPLGNLYLALHHGPRDHGLLPRARPVDGHHDGALSRRRHRLPAAGLLLGSRASPGRAPDRRPPRLSEPRCLARQPAATQRRGGGWARVRHDRPLPAARRSRLSRRRTAILGLRPRPRRSRHAFCGRDACSARGRRLSHRRGRPAHPRRRRRDADASRGHQFSRFRPDAGPRDSPSHRKVP